MRMQALCLPRARVSSGAQPIGASKVRSIAPCGSARGRLAPLRMTVQCKPSGKVTGTTPCPYLSSIFMALVPLGLSLYSAVTTSPSTAPAGQAPAPTAQSNRRWRIERDEAPTAHGPNPAGVHSVEVARATPSVGRTGVWADDGGEAGSGAIAALKA